MVDSFVKYIQFEKRYSPKTVLSYSTDLHQFTKFLISEDLANSPEEASYNHIRAWVVSLVKADLDPRSINRKIACLRSFYKFLIRKSVIDGNPMTKIKVLKVQKKLPHFVSENDMIKLLDNLDFPVSHSGLRDRLILELFYGTGIRLSELISLQDFNISLRDQTIKVLGKRNKERVIPFNNGLVQLIEQYRAFRNTEVVKKPKVNNLFVTDSGEPLYPVIVGRIVKKYMNLFTSVEKKSPHVLRHSYATHLLNKGAEINAVKDLLGHTSLAATQVYTHNSIEKIKKAFDQAHPKA